MEDGKTAPSVEEMMTGRLMKYVKLLENENNRLHKENDSLRQENKHLYEELTIEREDG